MSLVSCVLVDNIIQELKKKVALDGLAISSSRSEGPSFRTREPIPFSDAEVRPYATVHYPNEMPLQILRNSQQEIAASGQDYNLPMNRGGGSAPLEYPQPVGRGIEVGMGVEVREFEGDRGVERSRGFERARGVEGGRERERIAKPNTSIPPENILMRNLEYNISKAASFMHDEGGVVEKSLGPIEDARPMDSNLICPICGRQFRIGQIQYYKYHVDTCPKVM